MDNTFPPLNLDTPAPARTGRWIAGGVILALVLAAGLLAWTGISQYNTLQYNDVRVGLAWNQVINQYTRRADLVPNLVAVVRSYAKHEEDLFTRIAAARTQVNSLAAAARSGTDAGKVQQFQAAQKQLSNQLGSLMQLAERYPELKSAALYQDLMAQLEGTENRLAYARDQYFDSLASYNFGLRRFPGNLLARQAGMREKLPLALADDRVVRPAAALDLK